MALSSQLQKVPRILDLLVARGDLTAPAVPQILAASEQAEFAGKFVGEIAVSMGLTTADKLKAGLVQQATQRAYAALTDINSMIDEGGVPLADLNDTPHFGNNGQVNNVVHPIERADALIAAANMGELITKLANKNPANITPAVQQGVVAAKNLTMAISHTDPAQFPLSRAEEWMDQAASALRTVANAAGVAPAVGEAYIENRLNAEVATGIMQTRLVNQALQQQGPGMLR